MSNEINQNQQGYRVLLIDARQAIVGVIIAAVISLGFNCLPDKRPSWVQEWKEVITESPLEPPALTPHPNWGLRSLCPVPSKSSVIELAGLDSGATFIRLHRPSLSMPENSTETRTGDLICGDHHALVGYCEINLLKDNFLRMQIYDLNQELDEVIWFRSTSELNH